MKIGQAPLALALLLALPTVAAGQEKDEVLAKGDSVPSGFPTDSGPPWFRFTDCPFPVPTIVDVEVTCGFLKVPENRLDPASSPLEIAVAIAEPKKAAPDPVLLLPGGPGGAPLPRFIDRFREWVPADRTTIVFDPRGTGFSGGAMCPELGVTYAEIASLDLARWEARAVKGGAQRACRNRLLREGINLNAYNSETIAQDVVALRRALGIREWNLVSVSYGVPFAREVMRRDPTGVRSSVLAVGPSPDLTTLLSRDFPSFRRALRRVAEGCDRNPGCAEHFPDVESEFIEVVEQLRDQPVTLDVDTAEFRLPRFTVNAQDFVQAIYFLLNSERNVAYVPAIVRGFADRDENVIRGVIEDSFGGLHSSFSSGMGLSVMCYDAETPDSEADWEQGGRGLPDAYTEIEYYLSHCGFWSGGRAPADVRTPARLDAPTLVITGEYDPMSPPSVGEEHLATLPRGAHVVIPGMGHMPRARSRDCWAELIRTFLQDPESGPDASCIESLQPVQITPYLPNWLSAPGQ